LLKDIHTLYFLETPFL